MTQVLLRPTAESDLLERVASYRSRGGDGLGSRVFDAAISSLRDIGQMPGAGSPRAGELSGVPGLRVGRVSGFPCGWFYLAHAGHVDVVRLLADAQDLPTQLLGVDT